jgi:hypothetical protein
VADPTRYSGGEWGAVLDGHEEEGIRAGKTRRAAIDAAMESYLDAVECGWEDPGERTLTLYRSPVYCAGDDTGEYQCECGDDHAYGDTLLTYDACEVARVRVILSRGGEARWEVLDE